MKRYLLIFVFLFVFLTGCKSEEVMLPFIEVSNDGDILVDIKGAVAYPGVYIVSSNSLVKDVIEIAGGALSNADLEKVNLVKSITDKEMIIIPYKNSNVENSSLININTASLNELMKLPRIGKAKAEQIINYRTSVGPFYTISDITKVKGISDAIYEQIKTYITV